MKVERILLTGGATYMPQVREALTREFGIEPELKEPDLVASKGACIYSEWIYEK